ncbi:MAG: hypothetical protein DMF00_01805 [Verrucomicrobia bacterium]|nr:MAG: hypothetical protein DMF00_01805 [Verrucomicrobiota bacterium]
MQRYIRSVRDGDGAIARSPRRPLRLIRIAADTAPLQKKCFGWQPKTDTPAAYAPQARCG